MILNLYHPFLLVLIYFPDGLLSSKYFRHAIKRRLLLVDLLGIKGADLSICGLSGLLNPLLSTLYHLFLWGQDQASPPALDNVLSELSLHLVQKLPML